MAYRDEIDMEKLNERERDLINMIDRNIAYGLEDLKHGKSISLSEAKKILLNNLEKNNLFNKKESIGIMV